MEEVCGAMLVLQDHSSSPAGAVGPHWEVSPPSGEPGSLPSTAAQTECGWAKGLRWEPGQETDQGHGCSESRSKLQARWVKREDSSCSLTPWCLQGQLMLFLPVSKKCCCGKLWPLFRDKLLKQSWELMPYGRRSHSAPGASSLSSPWAADVPQRQATSLPGSLLPVAHAES